MEELFILDIGNTNIRYGHMKNGILYDCADHPTGDIENLKIPENIPAAGASVVPEAEKKIEDKNIFWVNYKQDIGIDLSLVEADKLGADRIANLAGLAEMSKLPALIIDCGTAVSGELLSKDKVFLGGPIAPGRLLQRKNLHSYTALLPFIPLYQKNPETFGRTTKDAIMTGTDYGIIGAVKEFIRVAKQIVKNEDLEVYIGGGDSKILLENIKDVKPAPKDITLKGIAIIWERNAQKNLLV
ncbi:MAG: type III pantothenate kinase [Victivallales bacterium]|nr:type III pantothenate kinase [Victivallales bacterium]MCF7888506.1 type III pantothenate kinase [Victivallales bacterium]